MEFNQYNTTVQQWIHTVLENRETNADVVLSGYHSVWTKNR